jgi:hypothetical protein
MGRLDDSPPSTSSRPSLSTGANTPGADRLARIVEVLDLRHRQRQGAQDLRHLLPLHQAAGQLELAAFQAQRKLDQEVLVLELAPEVEVLALRPVAECVFPVDRGHDALDVRRRQARGVQAADHRAHAGAGDGIDGHVIFLEDLEHADVGGTARPATGQHQADARAPRFVLGRRFLRRGTRCDDEGNHGEPRCASRFLAGSRHRGKDSRSWR